MLGLGMQVLLPIELLAEKTLLYSETQHIAAERFRLPGQDNSKRHRSRVRDRNGSPERGTSEDYSGEPDPLR